MLARVGLRKTPSTSKVDNEAEITNNNINGTSRTGSVQPLRDDVEMTNGYQGEKPPPPPSMMSSSTKTAAASTTKHITRLRKPLSPVPSAKVSDYLVGQQLDDALASGENVEIYWPLDEGDDIRCWAQVEALW